MGNEMEVNRVARAQCMVVSLLAAMLSTACLGFGSPGARGSVGPPVPVSVLIVGGSAAVGWVDTTGLGYVERGLLFYGERAHMNFAVTNRAIPGARIVNRVVADNYGTWLRSLGPGGIVVLAWGLLNDLRRKTPLSVVRERLKGQIHLALRHADVVVLVTPPATRASFEQEAAAERRLVRAEIGVARSFHSPRVYVANVFRRETAYVKSRHLSYRSLMDGVWDPNTRGHALAGQLLGTDLEGVLPADRVTRQIARLRDGDTARSSRPAQA